jgi:hypothetical protein
MDKDDSDEDSLGLDDDEGLAESLAKTVKESKAKRPLQISVGGSFANVADGNEYSLVIFPKPAKTFYYKAVHQVSVLTHAHKKRKALNPKEDGAWIRLQLSAALSI